jgi:hypothetical protein
MITKCGVLIGRIAFDIQRLHRLAIDPIVDVRDRFHVAFERQRPDLVCERRLAVDELAFALDVFQFAELGQYRRQRLASFRRRASLRVSALPFLPSR